MDAPCQRKSPLIQLTEPIHSQRRSLHGTQSHTPGKAGEETAGNTSCSILQLPVWHSHQHRSLGTITRLWACKIGAIHDASQS